jgi:putative ABC transport system permease protein
VLSNALVALSGAMAAQLHEFSDISMGNGTIVVGLASIIIGERLLATRSITITIIACVAGAVLYKALIAIALHASGFALLASDIFLITSIMIVLIMITKKNNSQRR